MTLPASEPPSVFDPLKVDDPVMPAAVRTNETWTREWESPAFGYQRPEPLSVAVGTVEDDFLAVAVAHLGQREWNMKIPGNGIASGLPLDFPTGFLAPLRRIGKLFDRQ